MRKIIYILFITLAGLLPVNGQCQMMAATIDRDVYNYWEATQLNRLLIASLNVETALLRPNLRRGDLLAGSNYLVFGYKQHNIWDSMQVIYPVIIDTVVQLSRRPSDGFSPVRAIWAMTNLKNPAANRLAPINLATGNGLPFTTPNGIAFGSTVTGGGTNGVMNTGVPQNVYGSFNSLSLSVYSMTNNVITGTTPYMVEMGGLPAGSFGSQDLRILVSYNNTTQGYIGGNGTAGAAGALSASGLITDTRGLFSIVRTANNQINNYRNSTQIANNTVTQTGNPSTTEIVLGANRDGATINGFTNRTIGYADIGRGISAVGVARKYEIVNRYFQNINRPTF